jgi:hypothetical protein
MATATQKNCLEKIEQQLNREVVRITVAYESEGPFRNRLLQRCYRKEISRMPDNRAEWCSSNKLRNPIARIRESSRHETQLGRKDSSG